MSYDLKPDDIWINEDFSNDYPEFRDKTKYVYTAQLPWLGTKEQAESLKQQIIAEHEFYLNCNKKYPNLANYTIGLLKNQRTDQDKENERIVEFLKKLLEHWKEHDLDEIEYIKCRKCKIVYLLNFEMPQDLRSSVYNPFSETKS